ncbi:39S ribosomal protein L40, mitochondrial-like [Mizuhopecten yessoensis]|uniref:Large ribosomal subunit protein mL40 n=1 Tax=Mizuhopecten yessoensis TaxID=6573 RepID=A0A210R2M5_MIZYE|nr:39S ribosomal protein L40, mitochondrial-like [Mizuhopecten yessoensis]OWF55202.1 39S ribosomal protein L40, mitochondrial [Mizuhopecten yessoensis]
MAAPMINSLTANFSRLGVAARTASSSLQLNRCLRTQAHPLLFLTTDHLQKKGQHPHMNKRLGKKKKQLEKLLAKMDKRAQLIKAPIKERIIDMKLEKEAVKIRKRELSVPPEEREKEMKKFSHEWKVYCRDFITQEIHTVQKRLLSQQKALGELRKESEELYQKAIAIDEDLYNFSVKRLTDTPAIPGFQPIDGEYTDVTIKYD